MYIMRIRKKYHNSNIGKCIILIFLKFLLLEQESHQIPIIYLKKTIIIHS